MAENTDSVASAPEPDATDLTRRSRVRTSTHRVTSRARAPRSVPRPTAPVQRVTVPKASARARLKPVRSAVIVTMVVGLIATVALPAYAAWRPEAETMTLQQAAADDAQSLVVASDAAAAQLDRSSYSATTAEEIEKKKAAEAAAERARQLAARVTTTSTSSSPSTFSTPIDLTMTAPGSGEVRWPLSGFKKGRGLGDSGYHQGVDLLASCGTPLFAAAAGVVRVSQESFGGYGVAVTIDHVINGQRVSTLYGHMTYGSRQVTSGQTVEAGQLIGLVGSTGSSTACHVHFEVHINNAVVDPWAWLEQNAS
ncbi:M23 family metallopeptidase [Microbacterium sp. P04]|uniref:M23 family metallopeptidase n=1 Tax=Microbacterium sp. P04 TaxID=3366947 RepID=UPI003745174F